MGLDIWCREDIFRALKAAEQATAATTAAMSGEVLEPYAAGYRDGYKAALTTVAAAFGIGDDQEEQVCIVQESDLPAQEIFA